MIFHSANVLKRREREGVIYIGIASGFPVV